MKKLIVLSLIAPAMLGLSACNTPANNSADVAVNTDDANLTTVDDGNMTDVNTADTNVSNAM